MTISSQAPKGAGQYTGRKAGVKFGNSWVAFAHHIAGLLGLSVKFGGHPATDGKTIWLPHLPWDLLDEDVALMRRFIVHEGGHCRHSDLPAFLEFAQANPHLKDLLNGIEDPWMEVAQWHAFKGARAILREGSDIMKSRGHVITGETSAKDALVATAFYGAHVALGRDDLQENHGIARGHLIQFLGQGSESIVDALDALVATDIRTTRSTQDAIDLTWKVVKLLQQEADNADQQQDQQDPQQSDAGDGEGQQAGGAGGSSEEKSEGGQGDDNQGGNADAKGDDSSESKSDGQQSGGDEQSSQSGAGGEGDRQDEQGASASGSDSQGEGGEQSQSSSGGQQGGQGEQSSDSADADGDAGTQQAGRGPEKGRGKQNQNQKGQPAQASEDDGDAQGDQTGNGQDAGGNKPSSFRERVEAMLAEDGSEDVEEIRKAVMALAQAIANGEVPEYQGAAMVPEVDASEEGDGAGYGDVAGFFTPMPNPFETKALKTRVSRSANVLASRMELFLESQAEESREYGERGRLVGGRLWRTAIDDSRVFVRTETETLPRAAVSVLADLSGSMSGNRARLAAETMMLLSQVMQNVGNPHELLGFGDRGSHLLVLFKQFDEESNAASNRIGALQTNVGGGTPMVEGLFASLARLVLRDESKKVCLVLTDGEPCDPQGVVEQVAMAEADGVPVAFFLMGMGSAPGWMVQAGIRHLVINEVEDLAGSALSTLGQLLTVK